MILIAYNWAKLWLIAEATDTLLESNESRAADRIPQSWILLDLPQKGLQKPAAA